ncbi:MAG: hypothetical protein JRD88_03745 [Deltaproteobacteria bacterium]|jgi:hypothetical protein|nr:hypothetical protein [Deltaproteobacteria bacterium]
MKNLLFATDLLSAFRHDKHYCDQKNASTTLRKLNIPYDERAESLEQKFKRLVLYIMDHRGETEAFLTGTFIYPDAAVAFFKEHKLPVPAALQPVSKVIKKSNESIDDAQFDEYFDIICRNLGTVTDPLGTSYHTPIGRLIFRVYLETKRTQGIKTTAFYVLDHLKDFDEEKIVTSVKEDYVIWKTESSKEKLTSLHTIAKFILKLDREIDNIL